MPRDRRKLISQGQGSYHLISRISRDRAMFDDQEKEYLYNLLTVFASGFYVKIHAFCIMGNHFHIMATGLDQEAKEASKDELLCRYKLMYGEKAKPPTGSAKTYGYFQPDEDGGVERLRKRLGSISRFVQELKQTFSVWYNRRHDLKGHVWHDRFKGIILDKGEAQLVCSAYIDLNPLRANIVKRPEDYRWSSLGLWVRNPKYANQHVSYCESNFSWYREFVYVSGGVEREGKGKIALETVDDVLKKNGELGIKDSLKYRIKNLSEGIAIGSHSFISEIQKRYNRKYIRPRAFMKTKVLFTTRVLRLKC